MRTDSRDFRDIALTAVPALVLAMGGCGDEPEYPYEQSVHSIAVVPAVVHVAPGDDVVLTARLYGDSDGTIVLPEWARDTTNANLFAASHDTVDWEIVPAVQGVDWDPVPGSPGHHRVWLRVKADVDLSAVPSDLKVIATANGSSATVIVEVQASSQTQAFVTADDDPPPTPQPPDGLAILAERKATNGWSIYARSMSLTHADVGETDATSPLELRQALAVEYLGAALPIFANNTVAPASSAPVSMPIRVWLATAGVTTATNGCGQLCTLKKRIDEDVQLANAIFDMNRTGVRFSIEGQIRTVSSLSDFTTRACNTIRQAILADPPISTSLKASLDDHILNVVYTKGKDDDVRGLECAYSDGTGFIVVFLYNRAPTTLAHELLHALGMDDRTRIPAGHPSAIHEGFDAGNLMWTNLELRQATDRSRILIGQATWLNLDSISFLNVSSGQAPFDIVPPFLRPAGLPDAECQESPERCPDVASREEQAK